MVWYVGAFAKSGDQLMVKYIPTYGVDIEFVRRVWSLSDDDVVGGACYDVTSREVARVQEHVDETIDLEAYDYELCEEAD